MTDRNNRELILCLAMERKAGKESIIIIDLVEKKGWLGKRKRINYINPLA